MLVRLDDGDYCLAVRSAEDGIATAKATVARTDKQITAGQARVDQAKAAIDAAQVNFGMAQTDYNRQKRLVETDTASQSALDSAQVHIKEMRADVASMKASVTLALAKYRGSGRPARGSGSGGLYGRDRTCQGPSRS
ncbi:hypothetical protein [Breoghania sp.]|uniref:hypothetical protein n=1 Tax=Breoghania sp. TaxID=2065378 RepID=UPI00261BAE39|nr:hypothetical protein [Breoghania sp.]MDJ0930741.1 hypothetical protein [Breoghania sp.]